MKIIDVAKYLLKEFIYGFSSILPNDALSIKIRRIALILCGCQIGKKVLVYKNVLVVGHVKIGDYSSISNNVSINGASVGVYIGKNVMIAPGCCLVAFDHGMAKSGEPMISQPIVEAPIYIEDDVWIAAN